MTRSYLLYSVGVIALLAVALAAVLWWPSRSAPAAPQASATEETAATATEDVEANAGQPATATATTTARSPFTVTSLADSGAGSLRQILLDAAALGEPVRIDFDPQLFADPQTIALQGPLPELSGDLVIDGYIPDRLWTATGVIVSGSDEQRVFTVAEGARVELRSLTVAGGRADEGGGVLNRGELIVVGVTFEGNHAEERGGALASSGSATVINSTFTGNGAPEGSAISDLGGTLTVTNVTFSDNSGGALHSSGRLLLRNSIVANSDGGPDCLAEGEFDPASTHNLIEDNRGCGTPLLTVDPVLDELAYYNGPTRTIALGGGSPAVNIGDNDSALDEHGQPLRWDQRGNGDPRYVNGFTDLGAFERQANPHLVVDTAEESILMGCTRAPADCPLRAAIAIANASPGYDTITFDGRVFTDEQILRLERPLPAIETDLVLDAGEVGRVGVVFEGGEVFRVAEGVELQRIGVEGE